ncbi:hypothetical protein OIDMADRAFT_16830 [Oidiodendron maius Zn]|uniref:Uncharacterized protein n=1 Tax=Oidiodendron maius (strain Zn) TaxID=913774 RepID=A0A0C3D2H9_OIDMZ|nr:hypothetical protein OIDMADRAFT_16830 [Oidiodendron maius Zn]
MTVKAEHSFPTVVSLVLRWCQNAWDLLSQSQERSRSVSPTKWVPQHGQRIIPLDNIQS